MAYPVITYVIVNVLKVFPLKKRKGECLSNHSHVNI